MLWKVQRFVEHFLRHFCIIFDHFNADPFKWRSRTKIQVDHFREQVRFCCHLLDKTQQDLANLFATETEEAPEGSHQQTSRAAEVPASLPISVSQEFREELSQHNVERLDWIEQLEAQDRSVKGRSYQRMADYHVSTTDPDATLMQTKGGVDLGYHTHFVVDGGKAV